MNISKKDASSAVNIQRATYAMATNDGQSAEITMYGDIYEQRPTDWEGNPVEGQFILLSDFLADLEQISACKHITIRMNSYGGDACVSNTIHNRLRELARDGAKLTCVVDGVAMSGGTHIMCACDTVKANPSSVIMIHKCWSFLFGCYNADEMRQAAEQNDAWDKAQVEIYQRKTGLSNAVIMHMMSDTTYMTGREAKEKGFVDELLEGAEPLDIAASADGRSLFVRGKNMHLAPGMFAPDNIPTVKSAAQAAVVTNKNQPATTGSQEGGENSMTTEELRAQYPEQVAEVEAEARAAATAVPDANAVNAAVQAEQKRLQEIDEVARLFSDDLVAEAKYGEHACTAQELTYRAAQKAAKQGTGFLADLETDANASGAQGVSSVPGSEDKDPNSPGAVQAQAKADVAAFKKFKNKEAR